MNKQLSKQVSKSNAGKLGYKRRLRLRVKFIAKASSSINFGDTFPELIQRRRDGQEAIQRQRYTLQA